MGSRRAPTESQRIVVTFKRVSYGVIAALIGKVKEMYCGIRRQGENGKTFPVLMDHFNPWFVL